MSLLLQLQSALDRSGSGPCVVSAEEGRRRLTCELECIHPLAVEFRAFRLETGELAGASMADVRRISDALAARLTYLLEPINPVEQDAEQCLVQMRSVPPHKDDDGRSYYE